MLEDDYRRILKRIDKAKRRIKAGKVNRMEKRGPVNEEVVLARLMELLRSKGEA